MLTTTKWEHVGDILGGCLVLYDVFFTIFAILVCYLAVRSLSTAVFSVFLLFHNYMIVRILAYMCDKKGNSLFCRGMKIATNGENAELYLPFLSFLTLFLAILHSNIVLFLVYFQSCPML